VKSTFIILIISISLFSLAIVQEPSGIKIVSMNFKGVDKIDDDDLKEIMNLKKGEVYKEYIFNYLKDRDAQILEEYYIKNGYLDSDVLIGLNLKENNEVSLIIQVTEGPQYKVKLEDIIGIDSVEEKKRIVKAGDIENGDPITEGVVNSTEQAIFEYFAEDGYIYADISTRIEYDTDEKLGYITFIIDRGSRAYFGDYEIAGNINTKKKIIEREIKFKKGDLYQPSKIYETKEEIYKTGLYKDVGFKIQDYENQPTEVNLLILVKENKQRWFEVSPGYESPDRIILDLGWGHENIFGYNQRLSITGGIKYGFDSEEAEERIVFGYQEPWFLGFDLIGTENIFLENYSYTNYGYWKFGGTFELEKEISKKITVIESFKFERIGYRASGDYADKVKESEKANTASLETTFSYDSRDNPFNPSDGAYTYFSGEFAGGFLPGDNNFVRGIIEFNRYLNITKSGTLGLHLRTGSITPHGASTNIPIYERFFAGGAYSIRGYGYNKLGPLTEDGDPLGGNLLVESSIELRFQIPFLEGHKIPWIGLNLGNFWGGVFIDVGNVFAKFEDFKWGGLKVGAGIGIRYNTPIGPVRFDYGRNLSGDKQTGTFYLALGHAF
jgi:outer membrane protein assembly complex protein YaeT